MLLVRMVAFISGVLLLIMAVGAQTMHIDREDAYWMIVASDKLWLMMGDGTRQGFLHANRYSYGEEFWWSPNSQWMLHSNAIGSSDFYSVNIATPQKEYVLHSGSFGGPSIPAFSSDSQWVLYTVNNQYILYQSRLDGTEKVKIADDPECICYYGWTEHRSAYYMDSGFNTGSIRLLSDNAVEPIRGGPDYTQLDTGEHGSFIVYSRDGIFRMKQEDGHFVPQLLTEDYVVYETIGYLSTNWILFRGRDSTEDNSQSAIYRIRPNGSLVEKVLDADQYRGELNWSQDGEWLYFQSPYGYVRKNIGGYLTEVIFARYAVPYLEPIWTTDYQWLVFVADFGDGMHLYKMNANDGESALLFRMPSHSDPKYQFSSSETWIHLNYQDVQVLYNEYLHVRIRLSDGKVETLPDGQLINLSPQFVMMEGDLTPLWMGMGLMAVSGGLMLVEIFRGIKG